MKKTSISVSTFHFLFLISIWVILGFKDILPSPTEILHQWDNLASSRGLLYELAASFKTIIFSVFISSLLAFIFVSIAWFSNFRPTVHWISSLRFLGFSGIVYGFTMMTSTGFQLKIAMLSFGIFVFTLTGFLSIMNSIQESELDYYRTLNFGKFKTLFECFLFGKLDLLLDVIKQNTAIGWTLLGVVEGLVRSGGGIGSMLITENKMLNLSTIFAIQITILACGIIQDIGLGYFIKIVCPWSKMK